MAEIRQTVINNQILNKQIIVNKLFLNYYHVSAGKQSSSKTILFLHGWGVDSQLWFKIVPELTKKNWSMYFLDLPGFGQSQIPDTMYDVDDYKRIVYEFVKKMELKNVNFVGHSFGGRITIKLAAENPNFLEKIILVDTAGIVTASKIKKITALFAKTISPIFKLNFMKPIRKKFYFLIGSEYLENEKLSKIFSKVVSENLTRLLTLIKKPTLIVWGKNDKITPLYYGELMYKLIPKSKFVIFENAGHFSFLDEPEEFAKELVKFIE